MAVRQALQTIDNRINAFGVAEPVIQREGLSGDRIVVQLPGVDDPERVKRLLKSTAFLEFRIVTYPLHGGAARRAKRSSPTTAASSLPTSRSWRGTSTTSRGASSAPATTPSRSTPR